MAIEEVKTPINQSVVGHVPPPAAEAVAETPAATEVAVPPPAIGASEAPAIPPADSTGEKVATGILIGLEDVNAVAKVISQNFAGTPIAAIFALLGPAAGIGAAVLAQHLAHRGFDLSSLKPAEIL